MLVPSAGSPAAPAKRNERFVGDIVSGLLTVVMSPRTLSLQPGGQAKVPPSDAPVESFLVDLAGHYWGFAPARWINEALV